MTLKNNYFNWKAFTTKADMWFLFMIRKFAVEDMRFLEILTDAICASLAGALAMTLLGYFFYEIKGKSAIFHFLIVFSFFVALVIACTYIDGLGPVVWFVMFLGALFLA